MKEEKLSTMIEVFICNHQREGSECCFDKGSKVLTDELKKWAKSEHGKEIKVFRSGCLGKCESGIAIACYPEKKLLTEVHREDVNELKKGLEEALKNFRT